jgi:hypothetical protein
MKRAKNTAVGLARGLPAIFVRGAIASGMTAAMQGKRAGKDLLQAALVGGAALSTAVSVEELLFNKEWKLAKKMKRGKKNKRGGLDMTALETLLRGNQPAGLAALGPGQQFLTGALIGLGVAYLLGDENLRGKLIRAGMQLYTGLAGGFEEIKEQMADIQAEMAAEQRSV